MAISRLLNQAHNLPRLARTLIHLAPGQVAWRAVHVARLQAYRRLSRLPIPWITFDVQAQAALRQPLVLETTLPEQGAHMVALWRDGHVSYHGVRGQRHDWQAANKTRLWQYEKHYHVEVMALASATAAGDTAALDNIRALLASWHRDCPPMAGASWEPYPIARRILHWSVALAACPSLAPLMAGHLAPQLRHLSSHLERHLLGNHLLCDLLALVAGAAVIEAPGLDEVWQAAASELRARLADDILDDGGYGERTAQYHAVMLRDVLWASALCKARGLDLGVQAYAQAMLQWLQQVVRADGSFPWINDAAPDTTPSFASLQRLAEQAGVHPAPPPSASQAPLVLRDTGWALWRPGKHELLFDFGIVGPKQQPGHGHADALAYELIWNGTPVVVDTGITTYAPGATRDYERSPQAHATLSVNGEGADEVWASFRVGGRAHPWLQTVQPIAGPSPEGGVMMLGHCRSFRAWQHTRRLVYWPGLALVVMDELENATEAVATSHIPLAPGWQVQGIGSERTLEHPNAEPLRLVALEGTIETVAPGWHGQGFEQKSARDVVPVTLVGGRCVYAITAGELRVQLESRKLQVWRDNKLMVAVDV